MLLLQQVTVVVLIDISLMSMVFFQSLMYELRLPLLPLKIEEKLE